jgi:hypothetical protein
MTQDEAIFHSPTIAASVARTRNLLIAMSIFSAWLVAVYAHSMLRWSPIRSAVTHNLVANVSNALEAQSATTRTLTIPLQSLRGADRARLSMLDTVAIRRFVHLPTSSLLTNAMVPLVDSSGSLNPNAVASLPYPLRGPMKEQLDWCAVYYPFVLQQWSSANAGLVGLLVDRAAVASSVLPPSSIHVPEVAFPFLNISADLDDVAIVACIILTVGYLWFMLSLAHLRESAELFYGRILRERGSAHRYLSSWRDWLSLQFFFVNKEHDSPARLAYPLVFAPYIATVFVCAHFIQDTILQVWTYDILLRVSMSPLAADGNMPFLMQEPYGTILLRIGLMGMIIYLLQLMARRSWNHIRELSELLIVGGTGSDSRHDSFRFAVLTLLPLVVLGAWFAAQAIFLSDRVLEMGWTYGVPTAGAIIILAGLALCLFLARAFVGSLGGVKQMSTHRD